MGDNFHITEEMKAKPPGQSDLLGPANCYPPAQPAPDAEYVWPAEDTHPWTAADDGELRRVVLKHRLGDESLPWQAIARECNFGHNSGSCQQRYAQLPELQWADKNKIYFPAMGGEPIATKMNNMRK